MRSIMKWQLILAFLILWAGTAKAESIDRIVAVVNGDVILYSELQENLRNLERTNPEIKQAEEIDKARVERDALQQMIRERLVEQETVKLKIVVTPKEVDDTIADIKNGNHYTDAQMDQAIGKEGKTKEKFREGIKKEVERMRLLDRVLKSKTVITDAQVDAYLKDGGVSVGKSGAPAKPVAKETKRLAILLVSPSGGKTDADAEKLAGEVLSKLKGGADFAKMVKQYSTGPAVSEGGDVGFVSGDEMAPFIASAVQGLKANQISGVVKGQGGYYILKVLDAKKEKLAAAPPESPEREKVRKQLYNEELGRKFEEWVKELESKAYIQVLLQSK